MNKYIYLVCGAVIVLMMTIGYVIFRADDQIGAAQEVQEWKTRQLDQIGQPSRRLQRTDQWSVPVEERGNFHLILTATEGGSPDT